MVRNMFFKGKSPPQAKKVGVLSFQMMNLQGKLARRRRKIFIDEMLTLSRNVFFKGESPPQAKKIGVLSFQNDEFTR